MCADAMCVFVCKLLTESRVSPLLRRTTTARQRAADGTEGQRSEIRVRVLISASRRSQAARMSAREWGVDFDAHMRARMTSVPVRARMCAFSMRTCIARCTHVCAEPLVAG